MKKNLALCFGLSLLLAGPLSGCRALSRMLKGNAAKQQAAELAALEKKGDVATLKSKCFYDGKDRAKKNLRSKACASYIRANVNRLKSNLQCDGIEKEYDAMYWKAAPKARSRSVRATAYQQGGIFLARCKKWDFLFARGLYGGGTRGGGMRLLQKIDKAGVPVEKAFVAWLARQEKPFMGGSAGGRPLVNGHIPAMQASLWLRNKRSFGHCKVFTKAANASPTHIQSSFIEYLYHAKCKGLRPILLQRLAHDRWQIRSNACILLGKVGKKADVSKLSVVRRNDSVVRVRYKCAGAISKIRLRG